jgi:hypothetical protein
LGREGHKDEEKDWRRKMTSRVAFSGGNEALRTRIITMLSCLFFLGWIALFFPSRRMASPVSV